jgi:hypothetical protein
MTTPYQQQVWHGLPARDTPLSPDRLTHIEQGIAAADQRALDAKQSVAGKADQTALAAFAVPRGAWQANTAYPANSVVVQGGRAYRAPAAGVPSRAAFNSADWESWSPAGGNIAVLNPGDPVTGLADGTLVFEWVPVGSDGTYVFPKGDPGEPGAPGSGGGSSYDVAAGASTATIQAALNSAEGAVRLGPGTFNITTPLILPRRCSLVGQGGATHLVAATPGMAAVILVGNGGPVDRWAIRNLVIDCNGNATAGIDVNVVGTTGNDKGEPDTQGIIENLYIDDPTYGIWYRGSDTQAVHTTAVRVRRAAQYGFYIQAPDNWWRECEATTTGAVTPSAGFYAGGANCHFDQCKAWYCRGYGWNIVCTRSVFIGCEAQDNQLHGWWLQFDKNSFVGCWSDMAGRQDVGGVPNNADGFYMEPGFTQTTMVGCFSIDRAQGVPAQQRYGFNVPGSWYNLSPAPMVGFFGYGNTAGLLNQR